MFTDVLDALNWRYATKRMNHHTVPQASIDRIVEAARLAPSSYGLQPYTLLVITDPQLRARIQQQAAPQPQLTECSHLLVFATWASVDEPRVDEFLALTALKRQIPVSDLQGYGEVIKGTLRTLGSNQARQQWAARQAYIALGMALTVAALEGVDATPMEGFDPLELDRILGLEGKQLNSVVMATLGYRDTDQDALAGQAKVRRPLAEFRQVLD
ncbi:NAD(P)H-dependent oxidoreductase [Marinobacter mobilis]|uniref:Nitroreductase n=1 Tax=Marinobacter mobilis TaxID=488533 RepID=A0A1H2XYT3_9GAMM|nr:NAD(P)H-dependent oxidoreductase [Marinobacter mobilis]SDW98112.1 Nitroreductase [Marinobacter mobilis]